MTTDFVKSKVHFTIALLATIFALHPFFTTFDKITFVYMGQEIPLSYGLMTIGAFLAAAVYFYATDLMGEHSNTLSQMLGNYFYSLAIMTVPFYLGIYTTTIVEAYMKTQEAFKNINFSTPTITIGVLVTWVVLWQVGSFVLRHYLTKQDWLSKIDQLADKEMISLKRADDLMSSQHADLAIIEFHRAVIARLKMACMKQGRFKPNVIKESGKLGLLNSNNQDLFDVIQKHYEVAKSPVPVAYSAVGAVKQSTKAFLATIPI